MRYHWPGAQPITAAQAPYQQLHGWLTHVISFVKQQRPHLNNTASDDYIYMRSIAGPELRWNDMIRRRMMGGKPSQLARVNDAWRSLTKPQRIAWDAEAAAQAPGLGELALGAPADMAAITAHRTWNKRTLFVVNVAISGALGVFFFFAWALRREQKA